MNGEKPREIAVSVLSAWRRGPKFLEELLQEKLESNRLSAPDRALVQELACGVIRWRGALDFLIAQKTGGRKQAPIIQDLLRLGLYQLFWLQRIPDHAAVDESVQLAKKFRPSAQAGFVNAVLRGFARERAQTAAQLARLKQTDLALGYSHPAWLVRRWRHRWGETETRQLLEWNNTPPKIFARVNGLAPDAGRIEAIWREEGVQAEPFRADWVAPAAVYELQRFPSIGGLPSFQSGLFYVQDPSTLLAARILAPAPGESALDSCAAPGGKTAFIAQLMGNQGDLIAEDLDPKRLRILEENCRRLKCHAVRIGAAGQIAPRGGLFDRILLDAPCSNTGVMRRRVELRWRIEPEEITRLAALQFELLKKAAARLRSGGVLVYSTCSLEPEENEAVARAFLAARPDFALEQERSLWPFRDGVDGAYVARLISRP